MRNFYNDFNGIPPYGLNGLSNKQLIPTHKKSELKDKLFENKYIGKMDKYFIFASAGYAIDGNSVELSYDNRPWWEGGGGKPSEIIQNYIILISYRVKIAGTNVYSDWTQHFGSDAQFFNNLGHCMRQADKRYALQKKQSNWR